MKFSLAAVPALPRWTAYLTALLCGALLPLTFAPFDVSALALPSLTGLILLLHRQGALQGWLRALCFGLGYYGVGVSWIFVSIHTYGQAPLLLAGLLTGLFVLFIALVFSLPFWVYGRWFSQQRLGPILAFPLLWLIGEWLRSWLLTGFPWLYLGYAHLDTWLASWAPLVGVMGVGLILTLTAGAIAQWLTLWRERRGPSASHWGLTALILVLWPTSLALQPIEWTRLSDESISVGMVQPNIPQERKWDPAFVEPTMDRLVSLSEDLWQHDWVIWPEAAIPRPYHQTLTFLDEMHQQAIETDTSLISGIIYDDPHEQRFYNSVVGFGKALGLYHKRRLVPFGEYVPLEDQLRGLIHFFDLPTSIIHPGPEDQRGVQVGEKLIAPSICYEIVYPDSVAASARDTEFLLTISNDGWFADSLGPQQHMQMARMRALETGRYLIRSTNNGISAIVDEQGKIQARAEQFATTTLSGQVHAAHGQTPFMRWGTLPLVISAVLVLVVLAWPSRARQSWPIKDEVKAKVE